jgi:hypothetical protein
MLLVNVTDHRQTVFSPLTSRETCHLLNFLPQSSSNTPPDRSSCHRDPLSLHRVSLVAANRVGVPTTVTLCPLIRRYLLLCPLLLGLLYQILLVLIFVLSMVSPSGRVERSLM